MAVLEARGVSKVFRSTGFLFGRRREGTTALEDVDVAVGKGEIVGLVGESGSGKTTLARMFNRLIRPTQGEILADGVDIARFGWRQLKDHRLKNQMIFQNADAALHPAMRVEEILLEALGLSGSRSTVASLLADVGLSADLASKRPSALSGGQKRRVGIARILAMEPEVILADEPLAGLDTIVGFRALKLIYELVRERCLTMVYITHDLEVASQICDRVYVMYAGRVVATGPGSILEAGNAVHPYVRELVRNTVGLKNGGESGSTADDPSGGEPRVVDSNVMVPRPACVWLNRCEEYQRRMRPEQCRDDKPKLSAFGDDRRVACHYAQEMMNDVQI